MREWVSSLGIYLWPVIILVFEIIFFLILMTRKISVDHSRRRVGKNQQGESIYCNLISDSALEMHVLVAHEERKPIFATRNIESVLGIDWNVLFANLNNITRGMDESTSREFRTKYDTWDRAKPIIIRFFCKANQCWMQLSITKCSDSRYDLFEFRDITDIRKQEQEMEERLIEAESVSQSKTTFLSRMSHEIRTPMNGICGMLTLIKGEPHNDIIDGYLTKAENLSEYMLSLINDILDMSRIENEKLELEAKPFDIRDVAEELRNMFQRNVEESGVRFIVEMLDFQDHCVVGDRLRFSQVLINCISNAVKFTSEGEIRVTFREMMHEHDHVNFMVRVHDTGEGMDPAFVSRIFRPFEQEDASVARRHGGTGLGMAITEQIVRLMGGEIVIDTMPGKGSDFTVYLTLPIAECDEVQHQSPAVEQESDYNFTFQGKHILIAEDNDINAEIAEMILGKMGAQIDRAENGQIAVDKFKNQPRGTYDFILMDIQMPVMDGREAAQQIRNLDRPDAGEIPIFALSADAFVEDQRLSEAVGMNGHFSKPIDFKALQVEIGNYFRTHPIN